MDKFVEYDSARLPSASPPPDQRAVSTNSSAGMEIPGYECPVCGNPGFRSIFYDTCTACANLKRFGSFG